MTFLYTIELFGRLRVRRHAMAASDRPDKSPAAMGTSSFRSSADVERFRTQKTGALFAYLGCFGDRKHSREVLTELFWPDIAPAAARHNLSMALSSLRAQFEPAPLTPGSVLSADRLQIGITAVVTTDVARFGQLLDSAFQLPPKSPDRIAQLAEAVSFYRPDLLPGYYEPWIVPEQERLAERFRAALMRLAEGAAASGKVSQAIRYARRAAESNPFDEDVQTLLQRLGATPDVEDEDRDDGTLPSPPQRRQKGRTIPQPSNAASSETDRRDLTEVLVSPVNRPTQPVAQRASPSRAPAASSLAVPLTRFFGREIEGQTLMALLAEPSVRLITIAGPGGVGKTRLAQETLRRLDAILSADREAESLPDAVLWLRKPVVSAESLPRLQGTVDTTLLHPGDTEALLKAISEALGLFFVAAANAAAALSAIADALLPISRPLLMVDNLESIMPEGAETLATLLSLVPHLTCLVTSRVRVGLAGEAVVDLPPLPNPLALTNSEAAEVDIPSFAEQWAGVALFADRAQQVRPDFALTSRNIRAVVRIVHFLEGLPLALELAAARIQLLSPAALLSRLRSNRFDLLTGSSRRFGKRHASLQATLAWSVEYLAPEVRQFLAELSVFSGGFTVEAAETLTACPLALDFLAELCDASLVRATGSDSSGRSQFLGSASEDAATVTVRFHQMETIRAFTEKLLPEAATNAVRLRHAQIYERLARELGPRLEGGNPGPLLDEVDAERANLKAAMEWLLLRSAAEPNTPIAAEAALAALRLASDIYRYWLLRGGPAEGRRWIDATVAATSPDLTDIDLSMLDAEIRAALLAEPANRGAGNAAGGETAAPRNPVPEAFWTTAVNRLGVLAMTMGDIEAAAKSFRQALALRRLQENRRGIAAALSNLSILSMKQDDYESARLYGEEALLLWRAEGDAAQVATSLANLGAMAHEAGDLALAERLLRESIVASVELGHVYGEVVSRSNLGEALLRYGRLAEAEAEYRAVLRGSLSMQATASIAYALLDLALLRSWTVTYPEAADALTERLRATARRYMTASHLRRSRFIEEQELRCLGPWPPPASTIGRQAGARATSGAGRGPSAQARPAAAADDMAAEDRLEQLALAEQELEAAGRAASLLAQLVLGQELWYSADNIDVPPSLTLSADASSPFFESA